MFHIETSVFPTLQRLQGRIVSKARNTGIHFLPDYTEIVKSLDIQGLPEEHKALALSLSKALTRRGVRHSFSAVILRPLSPGLERPGTIYWENMCLVGIGAVREFADLSFSGKIMVRRDPRSSMVSNWAVSY